MNNSKHSKIKYIMSFGHFSADFVQGALSAMLPFLIGKFGLTYTRASFLVMISNLFGSLIQPVFGYAADKIDKPHIMTAGVILAGVGMASVGFMPSYPAICVAVVISGIGVAMFHPQGAQMINKVSQEGNIGTNMGIFSFGGNAGFTIGPAASAALIATFGLAGTGAFLLPAVIFTSAMIIAGRNGFPKGNVDKSQDVENSHPSDRWGQFCRLAVYVTCRSIIFSGLSTFLILYFIEHYHTSEAFGSALLSLFFGIQALSSLGGGKLSDMIGFKTTLIISSVSLLITLVLFPLSPGLGLAILILLPLGIGSSIGYSSMVTLGQKFLPNHTGFASGVTLGLSVSIGGIVVPLLGRVGDLFGLTLVFYILAAVAAVALMASMSVARE